MANIHINKDSGDNATGDGSSGSPYETLAHAFDQSSANDTIICQDSTATYDFVDDTFDHNITIQGESDDASGAVFDGSNGSYQWTFSTVAFTIEKLTFQNIASKTWGNFEINAKNDTTCTFDKCIFNINAHGSGTWYLGGIIVTKANTGNANSALDITNCAFNCPVTTNGVVVYQRNDGSMNFTNTSIYLSGTATLKGVFGSDEGAYVIKNSIVMNDTSGAQDWEYHYSTGSGFTTSYSCFYDITNSPSGTGDITSDPLFVDGANGDFRLRPSSPCIDTGTLI